MAMLGVAALLPFNQANADLVAVGDTLAIDFESPSPAFGTAGVGTTMSTNFNLFDTQAADGATVSQTGFVNLAGDSIAGVGFGGHQQLGQGHGTHRGGFQLNNGFALQRKFDLLRQLWRGQCG